MFCDFHSCNGLQDYTLKSRGILIRNPVWSNGPCAKSGATLGATHIAMRWRKIGPKQRRKNRQIGWLKKSPFHWLKITDSMPPKHWRKSCRFYWCKLSHLYWRDTTFDSGNCFVSRPHSTYQKVVQGKCPPAFLHFNGVVCSNTLSRRHFCLEPWPVLCYSGQTLHAEVQRFSNTSFGRTLPGSNFGGLLLEQTFCRHFAAFLVWLIHTMTWESQERKARTPWKVVKQPF